MHKGKTSDSNGLAEPEKRLWAAVAWRHLAIIPALFLLASNQPGKADVGQPAKPSPAVENKLSTNWMAAAMAALPRKDYENGALSFQEVTNLLCRESRLGNNEAKGFWGCVLLLQSSSPKEAQEGLRLLRKSANDGFVGAMLTLGFLFEGDQYVPKDYKEAFHWFSLAADKGDAEGELQLGGCYHSRLGTMQDFAMAPKYYRRSADQTNYVAMKSLGYLLVNGYGVEKNLDAAKYWLTRAAKEGGNRRAMYNLGVLCMQKASDPNSIIKGFQW